MKSRFVMSAVVLAFGLALAGCDDNPEAARGTLGGRGPGGGGSSRGDDFQHGDQARRERLRNLVEQNRKIQQARIAQLPVAPTDVINISIPQSASGTVSILGETIDPSRLCLQMELPVSDVVNTKINVSRNSCPTDGSRAVMEFEMELQEKEALLGKGQTREFEIMFQNVPVGLVHEYNQEYQYRNPNELRRDELALTLGTAYRVIELCSGSYQAACSSEGQ